jgi:hypothetical protein
MNNLTHPDRGVKGSGPRSPSANDTKRLVAVGALRETDRQIDALRDLDTDDHVARALEAQRPYRWHVPGARASTAIRSAARPIEPHNPNQPARAIPNVRLTIECQFAAARMATERALASVEAVEPETDR